MRRIAAIAAALACAGALAAEPPGRAKARGCVPCHGTLGVSVAPDAPHLAAQPRGYLVAQLRAYRDGKRMSAVMNVVAKPLTDRDIDDLAEWYASLAIEARERP